MFLFFIVMFSHYMRRSNFIPSWDTEILCSIWALSLKEGSSKYSWNKFLEVRNYNWHVVSQKDMRVLKCSFSCMEDTVAVYDCVPTADMFTCNFVSCSVFFCRKFVSSFEVQMGPTEGKWVYHIILYKANIRRLEVSSWPEDCSQGHQR
jgi:hypothetical protein